MDQKKISEVRKYLADIEDGLLNTIHTISGFAGENEALRQELSRAMIVVEQACADVDRFVSKGSTPVVLHALVGVVERWRSNRQQEPDMFFVFTEREREMLDQGLAAWSSDYNDAPHDEIGALRERLAVRK